MSDCLKEFRSDPFDVTNTQLRSLQSGIPASDELIKDFKSAKLDGEKWWHSLRKGVCIQKKVHFLTVYLEANDSTSPTKSFKVIVVCKQNLKYVTWSGMPLPKLLIKCQVPLNNKIFYNIVLQMKVCLFLM